MGGTYISTRQRDKPPQPTTATEPQLTAAAQAEVLLLLWLFLYALPPQGHSTRTYGCSSGAAARVHKHSVLAGDGSMVCFLSPSLTLLAILGLPPLMSTE